MSEINELKKAWKKHKEEWAKFIMSLPEVDYFDEDYALAPIESRHQPIGVSDGNKMWKIVENDKGHLARKEIF